jgi:hypothetical protein
VSRPVVGWFVQGRAAIQEPTAHPAVGQADSVTCSHVIADPAAACHHPLRHLSLRGAVGGMTQGGR